MWRTFFTADLRSILTIIFGEILSYLVNWDPAVL